MTATITESEIVVLGAGMVGAATALELQRRGREVTLLDRKAPGEETSYGNAGVIEGGPYVPLAFPRDPRDILRFATNRQPALHFHWRFLPWIAPWLSALSRNSSEARLRENGAAVHSLTTHAPQLHEGLLDEAGRSDLLRKTGWLQLYRSEAAFAADGLKRHIADETGCAYSVLDPDAASELEPHLSPAFHKAVYWPSIWSVADPGAATKAVAELFAGQGGRFARMEVVAVEPVTGGWRVKTGQAEIAARHVVIALGPWSMDLLRPLGYRFPLAVKRGYHLHFRGKGNATLSRPVVDLANGYVITPMAQGIRLTTGVEFADRDAPATPVQIARAEKAARGLFPLEAPVDPEPWMGRRPCLPDSRPIIGPAPRHDGLWLNFGHAHLGFTLGPVSARLLAEMMNGGTPIADPTPFAATRF